MVESERVHGLVFGISDFKFQSWVLSLVLEFGFGADFGAEFELAQEEELAGLADFGGDLRGGGASAASGDFGVGDAR